MNLSTEVSPDKSLLSVEDVTKIFPVKSGLLRKTVAEIRAVDGISFSIERGKTLGLVGESGSGKTTVGKLVLGTYKPSSGRVLFDDKDVSQATKEGIKKIRKEMSVIFQDPLSSLDPRMSIYDIVSEPLTINTNLDKSAKREKVKELLQKVGLRASDMEKYPQQFSGGQRQRIAIARSIALSPELIIADEAVSALDVSVQAKIINLLLSLQKETNTAFLFIAHDLSVVRYVSHYVAVMYLGKIFEYGPTSEIFANPLHPYTIALLSAIPRPDPDTLQNRIILSGEIPSASSPPSGCRFRTRCQYAKQLCEEKEPEFREATKGHFVYCHFYEEIQSARRKEKSVP
jgi:oligopeptide transport system ATP-binding protein